MTTDEFKVRVGELVGEYHESSKSMVNKITVKREYAGGNYYYVVSVKETLAVKVTEEQWTTT